jgi:molybdopterin-guanine dinucleotide biosynthesis protein A
MSKPNKESDISGVILAGGENNRFNGKNKAGIKIDGRSIISSALNVLEEKFEDIIIITNDPSGLKEYSTRRMVPDIFIKSGPLGGIHAALKATSLDSIFVVACDMPLLSSDMIKRMVDRYKQSDCEVLIPQVGNFIEPLHAIYSKSILERLNSYLSGTTKFAIKDFLTLTRVEYLKLPDRVEEKRVFTNINSPGDLENIEKK